MENVGQRIREERRKRDLTLEQLSQKTNLSKSFLSQIERDIAQPSVSSLKKIAQQFGISVVSLFTNETNNPNSFGHLPIIDKNRANGAPYAEDVKVVRANRRKSLSLPGSKVSYDLLTPDLNRQMEVMYLRADPTENSGDEPVMDPPGEKFGLVLKGTLEVRVRDQIYELQPGDSIYHPSHVPHSWRGKGEDPIEVIWVLTPPWF